MVIPLWECILLRIRKEIKEDPTYDNLKLMQGPRSKFELTGAKIS